MDLAKILIVEDSELLHKMYDLILARYKRNGTHLLFTTNGREGLTKLHTNPDVGLILLDINMPIMNGLKFLETIRAEEMYQKIPVIIISTEGKEEDTIRGLRMGASAYITKPFQPHHLQNLIQDVLKSSNNGNH